MTPICRITAWLAALTGSLAALLALGERVPAPPVLDLDALVPWLQRTDPAAATFSILRVAALGVVAYLLLSTLVLLAAHGSRVPALVAGATRFAAPVARQAARGAVGAGLAVSIAGTAAPAFAGVPPAPAHLVVDLDRPFAAWSTDPADPLAPPTGGPTQQRLDDDLTLVHLGPATETPPATTPTAGTPSTTSPPTTAEPTPSPPPRPADPEPTPPSTSAPATPIPTPTPTPTPTPRPADDATAAPAGEGPGDRTGHHTIVTGDHLWGVAERTLAEAWADPPSADEIATYLHRLIDENRSVLAIPDDPDLVLPGQVFALPAIGPR